MKTDHQYYLKIIALGILLVLGVYVVSTVLGTTNKENFVTVKGKDLYLNNEQFRSMGVNRYNLLTRNTPNGETIGCASPFSEEELDSTFSNLQSMGITSVRFWLFQSFTKSGEDLERFNFLLATAEKYNIKLIPVFENNWQDCTEGNIKSPSWYRSEYKSPYGTYPLSLKEYISKVVPLYKDNPTILAWEIMNEANSKDYQALYAFAEDVSAHVKSLDANHLVTVGVSGTRESAEDYKKLSTIRTIDILDYHDYDAETNPMPDTLANALSVSQESNKPLVVGESGIKKSFGERTSLFENKINAFFENGGAIYMIWSYGDTSITDDGFNFTTSDPVARVVREKAEALQK
ncbi:MAG: cellulase family glycosylhydrolase [Candidatus Levybacteria bacterium]|nr:cellulase family glycosylhydrolase [Candidatus Levybacteria bacterium]